MVTVRIARSWLRWAPVSVAAAVGCWWLVSRFESWEWLRNLITACVIAVCLGVLIWGLASVGFLTRGGFWVPFEGHGRWADVVARDGIDLTMRSSLRYGVDEVISFDRIAGGWIERRLDQVLPEDLPGPLATEPHPEWKKALDERAELLLTRLSVAEDVPAHTREWVHPSEEPFETHALRLRFAPARNGRQATVILNSYEWYPVVEVDGLFASFPDEDDEDGELPEWSPDRILRDTVTLLIAVFGTGRREPIEAWRILDGHDGSWEFYPRLLS